MKRLLVSCGVLWVVGVMPVAAAELTLERALEMAQEGNRDLAAAAARAAEQQASLRISRAARKPSLELSQRLTRIDDSTVARANSAAEGLSQLIGFEIPPFVFQDSYRTQLSFDVPLWTSGSLEASIRGEKRTLDARQADEDAAWRVTRQQVAQHFFAVASNLEVLETRKEALKRTERRLREAEHRLEIGLTTRQEVLRWQVQVEQALSDLADAEAALFVSRLELADVLGVPLGDITDPTLPNAARLQELRAWTEGLEPDQVLFAAEDDLDQLPEVRAAQARAAAGQEALRRTKANRLPRLDANASYGWLENETPELDGFDNWSATLQLRLPIDIRGDLRASVAREEARLDSAQTVIADARANARLAIGRAIAEVVRTRTRLRSAERSAEEAAARRELLGRQADVGLTGLLDLIDADATLVDAEVARANARVALLAAIAELELTWPGAAPPADGLIP